MEEDNENKVNKVQFILCNHLWLRRGKLRLLSQRYNEWIRWKFRPQLPKFTQTNLKQRSRVGSNGQPIHKFDARESVRFWIEKGHQHAQTKTEKVSKVIERKKKEKDAKHTSRIFTKPFYAHWWVWKCNKMLGFLRLSFGTFFILPWDISSIPPLTSTQNQFHRCAKDFIFEADFQLLRGIFQFQVAFCGQIALSFTNMSKISGRST